MAPIAVRQMLASEGERRCDPLQQPARTNRVATIAAVSETRLSWAVRSVNFGRDDDHFEVAGHPIVRHSLQSALDGQRKARKEQEWVARTARGRRRL